MNEQMLIAGRYELGARIGEGGMGTVFRGVDTRTDEAVAIKRLKPDLVNAEMLARFAREGEALRQLNHPNIVKVLATVQDSDSHYIVMELVGGGSLSDLLKLDGDGGSPVSVERVLRIALDLCDALTRAHRLDIIHRDLKPANVLLAEDGTPRLTDFGVALMSGKERITETEGVVGTLSYLSPEAFGADAIDVRADIWAFGVLLFEMLAGQRPFDRSTVTQTLMAILNEPTPNLEELRPDCPVALIDLIYRMLEKDRRQRIPSVRQVGAELENILQGRATTPVGIQPVVSLPSKSPIFDTPTPSPAAVKHNLPAQTTPFIGREDELAELVRLLSDANTRLVTILAPGGMGKTRLALEIGQMMVESVGAFRETPSHNRLQGKGLKPVVENGVFFISLAPLTSPDFIISTIAESVGFQFYQGGEPKQQLLDFFREKSMLLIMDNFEHVLSGAGIVSDILQTAPQVKILATSRERLNLSGETLLILSGMDFPDWETPEDALNYSAVKLFMQSAKRVRPDFELQADDLRYVARLCRLVQGMPLGILLAASWVEVLSLREIADEIGRSIDFLESEVRDLPERHRSIRAVFDYSWNLLTDDERAVFAKLSVFRGGFTREAAQAVADANLRTLMALVNKSLLRRNPDSGRYEIHELLRQYAEARLREASAHYAPTLDLHSRFYADFMQQQLARLKSAHLNEAMEAIETELDNVRAMWEWALERRHLDHIGKAIECLSRFYRNNALFTEAEATFRTAVGKLDVPQSELSPEHTRLLGLALAHHGHTCVLLDRFEQAKTVLERSLTHLDEQQYPGERGLALFALALAVVVLGDYPEALSTGERGLALYRKTRDWWNIAYALGELADYYQYEGNFEKARELNAESIAIQRANAEGRVILGSTLTGLGFSVALEGDLAEGRRLMLDGLAVVEKTGSTIEKMMTFSTIANVERNLGHYDEAESYLQKSLAVANETGNRLYQGNYLLQLGDVLKEQGQHEQAEALFQKCYTLFQEVGFVGQMAMAQNGLGDIAVLRGNYAAAKAYFQECLTTLESVGQSWSIVLVLDNLGYVACHERAYEQSMQYFRRSLDLALNIDTIPFAINVIAGIALLFANTGQPERAVELLALGQNHKATERHTHNRRITPLLAELRSELPPDVYAAAYKRGKTLELDTVLHDLLAQTS